MRTLAVPGYRPHALLARGGRTETWDVTDLSRDCRAVLKTVRADRVHLPHVVASVRTEGHLLTTIAHPHLVRGYELLDGPRPAVVMETVPGATLAAVLDDRALRPADVVVLGRQLVSVLRTLHRHGWLHLDLKPENLVVQQGRVVLLDLGLATRPGRLERSVGTDGYAAPEQESGQVVGPAADVWGLGATLREALPPRAPAALSDLVEACQQPDPTDRPALLEVADRLDALASAPRRTAWGGVRARCWLPPRR